MIKPQSIRKGITIILNGQETSKQEILDLSKDWTPNQETLFKKALKQGGEVKINNNRIRIIAPEAILNSKGEKPPTHFQVPGHGDRF
jgi:hypothetical protein